MDTLIGTPQAPAGGDLIKDGSIQTFREDVIEASRAVPVIVDFWAPWCGPCKQLGPALEAAVTAAKGAVRLVKIDIDRNPEIAQQMRIQSIPAVYAFFNGQPVDGFVGAVPASQIKEFVGRLTALAGDPSGIGEALDLAKAALAEGRLDEAEDIFGQILEAEPDHVAAIAGAAKVLVARGALDEAESLLEGVPPEAERDQDIVSARSAVALARQAEGLTGDLKSLDRAVAADPDDHQARFDLALGLIGLGKRQEGVDHLLEIVRRDRTWNDDAARKQLLQLFEAAGFEDPLSIAGRRRLSTLLFS